MFGKIPVVDIIIVLLLCAVFGFAVWVLTRGSVQEQTGSSAQVNEYPFTATFLLERTGSEYTKLIEKGDKLYTDKGIYFGTVESVKTEPCIEYAFDSASGKEIGTVMPGQSSVTLSVTGKATASDSKGTFIGTRRLSLGSQFNVSGEKYFWSMRVIDLEVGK